jgi:hypothetical protein
MRELAERDCADGVVERGPVAPGRTSAPRARRRARVNRAESPLGWLRSRGLVDALQFEAGERLRGDYEMAALAPRVTMQWRARVDGGPGGALDPTLAQIAAKRRFDAAIDAVGRGLSDIVWRVVCAGEGLPVAENALGWPQRAGRLVLTLALDRLGDHYRLG